MVQLSAALLGQNMTVSVSNWSKPDMFLFAFAFSVLWSMTDAVNHLL